MANLKTKTLISVDTPWKPAVDPYDGKTVYEALGTVKGDRGKEEIVLRVNTERIGNALAVGSEYAGRVFKVDGSDKWRFKIAANDNPSLKLGDDRGGHSGGGEPRSGSARDGMGMAIGNALNNAVQIAIAELNNGADQTSVDLARVEEVAKEILAIGNRLAGTATSPAGSADPARDAALVEAHAAIKAAGLWAKFEASHLKGKPDAVVRMWNEAKGNPAAFAVAIALSCGASPEEHVDQSAGPADGEKEPENELPF